MNSNDEVNIYLFLFVDDILVGIYGDEDIDKLKETLNRDFKMKYIGKYNRILMMDINQTMEMCDQANGNT